MKLKKKELIIIIPMVVISSIIGFTLLFPYVIDEPDVYLDNNCQEGWFKYESEEGILCAKSELTQKEIDEFYG